MKAKRLGRGLSGLISRPAADEGIGRDKLPAAPRTAGEAEPNAVPAVELPIKSIAPNPYQPRGEIRREDLEELMASIKEHGLLQPVVVRAAGLAYELIAGERRLRAAEALGLQAIPALIRQASESDMQSLALVENLQRVDLNPIEKARALRGMMRNFDLTQADVAEMVGKAPPTISNLIRLLELPPEVLALVEEGALSEGHARALLRAKTNERRMRLATEAVAGGWSVRELETRATERKPGKRKPAKPEDPYVADIEARLRSALGTKVRVRSRGKGGTIEVGYHDPNELDRLLELFGA